MVSDSAIRDWERYAYVIADGFFLPGADVDDARQEALIGLADGLASWDGTGSLRGWLGIVIRRRLITAVEGARRGKHRPLTEAGRVTVGEDGELLPVVEMVPDPCADVHRTVVAREQLRRLTACVWGLTPLERAAVTRVVNGIAYTGDRSLDNALQRARAKLRAAA